jgi:hypothetical protein
MPMWFCDGVCRKLVVALRTVHALYSELVMPALPAGSSRTLTANAATFARFMAYMPSLAPLLAHSLQALTAQFGWLQSSQTKTLPGTAVSFGFSYFFFS